MSATTAGALVMLAAALLLWLPSQLDRRQNRLGQSRPDLHRLADPTPLPGEEWVQ